MEAKEIVTAALGAGATIVVGAIGIYKDELKNRFLGTKDYQFLEGSWTSKWEMTSQASEPIDDSVKIEKVQGSLIKGIGTTRAYGEWPLKGKAVGRAVSLDYGGKGLNAGLIGVVMLRIVTERELAGYWSQYSPTGEIRAGTTTWTKL